MIHNFYYLGKSILNNSGKICESSNGIDEQKQFLLYQSMIPKSKNKEDEPTQRALCVDFDLENETFEFKLDKELSSDNREYFLALTFMGNGKKKFLCSNSISNLCSVTIPESIEYIEDKKVFKWLNENGFSGNYSDLLNKLYKIFFKTITLDDNEIQICILDPEKLVSEQYTIFKSLNLDNEIYSIIEAANSKTDRKKKEKELKKIHNIYDRLINKVIFNNENKKTDHFPSISLIKINNKHILEIPEYKNDYISMCYYDLFERQFESTQKNKVCHSCCENESVISNVSLPMKFYGTTNKLFLENLNDKNAYKSFSLCKNCYKYIITGMSFVASELSSYLFNNNTYFIPSKQIVLNDIDFKTISKSIFKSIIQKSKTFEEEISKIEVILKKADRKNFSFDMLFFYQDQQAFNIIKFIRGIEYKTLKEKLKLFNEYNKKYQLYKIGEYTEIGFNDIRYLLFPSQKSHTKVDPKLFRKDIIDLFDSFISGNSFSYSNLIQRFVDITNKSFHRDRYDSLSSLKMILILSVFNKVCKMKGVKTMNNGKAYTEINVAEYRDFFNEHYDFYGENYYRQGLFLLGTVINKILFQQYGKSSNFLKKINLKGLPARRIINLVNEVKEFTLIYKDVYIENGIWANITDRLTGIENSGLNADEIVFYILTGISFAEYIGKLKAHENKKENVEEELCQ